MSHVAAFLLRLFEEASYQAWIDGHAAASGAALRAFNKAARDVEES